MSQRHKSKSTVRKHLCPSCSNPEPVIHTFSRHTYGREPKPDFRPYFLTTHSSLHCLHDANSGTTYLSARDRVRSAKRRSMPSCPLSHLILPFVVRAPAGGLPPFGVGHRTPIHPATGWHSLLPASRSRIPNRSPHGSPALRADIRGFQVPLFEYTDLGACCRPGGCGIVPLVHAVTHRIATARPHYLLVQAYQPLWLVLDNESLHRFTLHSPYQLPNTSPARGSQEGTPLTFHSPHVK